MLETYQIQDDADQEAEVVVPALQVEDSTGVQGDAKGASKDDVEPRDVALEAATHTVNTDTEQDEHQDTEVVDINAPEENDSDKTAGVLPVPIHTEGQKSTASVNPGEGNTVQDDADQEAEVAVSAAPEVKRLGVKEDMDTMYANHAEELDGCL
jgi:hypothetical protein